jgi:hypothetical protein
MTSTPRLFWYGQTFRILIAKADRDKLVVKTKRIVLYVGDAPRVGERSFTTQLFLHTFTAIGGHDPVAVI